MIHLFLLLILLSCLGLTAAWMAENPGSVTMHWFDYRIDTSFTFMLAALLVSAYVLAWAYLIFRRLLRAPQLLAQHRTLRNYRSGLNALTHSVVALAAADVKAADTHTRKAEKLLGRTPLTLLLSAQISRLQGDDTRTQTLLEHMLEHKETEFLAARYLSESATRQHQLPKARELAQRAQSLHPAGTPALLGLHVRLREWQQAAIVVSRAVKKGNLSRQQQRHYTSLLHTQHALHLLEEGLADTALPVARKAVSAKDEFIPARCAYAQALIANGQHAKARRKLLHWWKLSPHPLLADAFQQALGPLPREARLKLVKKLAALKPESYESHMAVAQVAISCGDWRMAREALKKALAEGDTALACKRMAEVEQGEYSDYDAAARWLTRSTTATPAPAWTCESCGHTTRHWSAHCPKCESFDTQDWKTRTLTYTEAA